MSNNNEKLVKDIRRRTRKKYSSEEKIRIVLEGMRGEASIAQFIQEIIACFGDLTEVSGIEPGLQEQPVQFTPVNIAIPVEILLQGEAFRLVVNELR